MRKEKLAQKHSEDMQNILRAKAAQLKEVSPACNCADLGLKGKLCEVFMQKNHKIFHFQWTTTGHSTHSWDLLQLLPVSNKSLLKDLEQKRGR